MISASESKSDDQKSVPAIGTAKWIAPSERRETRALDTTMRVTTPENIAFNYQVVGPFRRIFAYGLDLLIALGGYAAFVTIVYLLFALALFLVGGNGGAGLVVAIMGVLSGFVSIGYFIVYWFYGAYFETNWNGQTLGKRVMKMRVISTDGSAIDGVQAILRNFFRLLDIMPFAPLAAMFQIEQQLPGTFPTSFFALIILILTKFPTCLFGLIIMMLTKNYQRIGDLVAGTVVITEEKKRPPNLATFADERVPLLAELIPTSFVVPVTMARAIADYVDQRKFLPFQRASEIASHLAAPLMEKFGILQDTDHDLFMCALYYKQFVATQTIDGYEALANAIVPGGIATPKKNVTPSTIAGLANAEKVLDFPGVTDIERSGKSGGNDADKNGPTQADNE